MKKINLSLPYWKKVLFLVKILIANINIKWNKLCRINFQLLNKFQQKKVPKNMKNYGFTKIIYICGSNFKIKKENYLGHLLKVVKKFHMEILRKLSIKMTQKFSYELIMNQNSKKNLNRAQNILINIFFLFCCFFR
jgi:hypothetical protein